MKEGAGWDGASQLTAFAALPPLAFTLQAYVYDSAAYAHVLLNHERERELAVVRK